ncbi:MAG: neutral zinc metallopeptidase, partial [Chromatocurvus sp.]
MKWQGRRGSDNVEDARGRAPARAGAPVGALINLVLRLFGIKGVLVLAAVGLVAVGLGVVDPATLLGGGNTAQTADYRASPEEQAHYEFVRVVLADTEDVWGDEFRKMGHEYRDPALVVYSSRVATACGTGDARMGPFYCPGDRKIYIDLGFYEELASQ